MKSKYLVVLAIAAAMLTLGLCAGCAAEDGKPDESVKPSESQSPISSNETAAPSATLAPISTPEPTPPPESTPEPVTQLPPLESVTVEANPLLYDFMNGCMDWHTSLMSGGTVYGLYLLRHESSPNILYCASYTTQGQSTLPVLCSELSRLVLSDKELAAFETSMSALSDSDVRSEDGWTFYLCGDHNYTVFNATGIIFSGDTLNTPEPPFVIAGDGWPTEWLRREPYVSSIRENLGFDMSNSWWDTWCYLGVYKFVPSASGMNVGDTYIKCTGIDSFEYHSGAEVYTDVHWNEIEDDLYHIGNIIPGIHDPYNGITFTP